MIYFKLILVSFIFFTFTSKANDVEIIELHKNRSLDQLVLEKKNNENKKGNEKNSINTSFPSFLKTLKKIIQIK